MLKGFFNSLEVKPCPPTHFATNNFERIQVLSILQFSVYTSYMYHQQQYRSYISAAFLN